MAEVHAIPTMTYDPSDMDSEGAGAEPPPGEGGRASAKRRERRKPKLDGGALNTLFKEFAYQYGSEVAWDTRRKIPIRISHLRHTFGHDAVKLWMASPKRRMVMPEEVVFDPSCSCAPEAVNLFHGWGVEPKAGDTTPFHAVLEHLVSSDEQIKDYVLNWLAYPLQHPGHKMPTALVFHGEEGSGKNMLFETMVDIHGRHGKVVGQRELESQWNDWMSACTFVIGDEVVSRQEMRHHKGVLKALITSKDVNIATKFMNLRTERNCMNIVFHSNETQPLVLDNTDRRYLVVWTAARGDKTMYEALAQWRAEGGAAHLMQELLTRNLSGWEWWLPPPMTKAKQDLIELGRLSPERFMRDWLRGDIPGLPARTCSSDQAFRAYRRWCGLEGERFTMTKPVFTRLCQRQAADTLTVRVCKLLDGTTSRVWVLASPPPDVSWSVYANEAIDAFEDSLSTWIRKTSPTPVGEPA